MSVVAIIRELLANNGALTAVVPVDQIVAGVVSQESPLPAISVMEVSTVELPHIDGNAPTTIVDGRAQVTVMAANLPAVKQALALARKACNYQRGAIKGFSVISVRRLANGPDFVDPAARIAFQSMDFTVLYYEPNT